MKKLLLFSAAFSLFTFMACNKASMEKDQARPISYGQVDYIEPTDDTGYSCSGGGSQNTSPNAAQSIFTIDNPNQSVNEKTAVLLSNQSLNALTYHWDFGNGDVSSFNRPAYSYSKCGNYKITLKVTDAAGRSHQTSKEIAVLCIYGNSGHN